MKFDWDPKKEAANIAQGRMSFADGARIFEGVVVTWLDGRRNYGEVRVVALGLVEGLEITVVYTDRQRPDGTVVRRLLSVRRSKRRERRRYYEAIEE